MLTAAAADLETTLRALRPLLAARFHVVRLGYFGSFAAGQPRPDSDVDVLVTFDPETRWTLFDWVDIQEDLRAIFGREVDLISRRGIEASQNYLRRKAILNSARVMYAA